MSNLADRECVPCRGGVPPLGADVIKNLLPQLAQWEVVAGHHLLKTYKFANFVQAMEFVKTVGNIAERASHHPDISFGWGYAEIKIWTHTINGLTESDFVLAAKIDKLEQA